MTRRPIPVTDHAVLRWLERVAGLDVEGLRAAIGRSGAVGIEHGATTVVVPGGKLVLSDGRVVSVLTRDQENQLPGHVDITRFAATVRKSDRRGRRQK